MFLYTSKTKSSEKGTLFNLQTLKCKENTYLQYMNMNRQPAANRMTFDINHQIKGKIKYF